MYTIYVVAEQIIRAHMDVKQHILIVHLNARLVMPIIAAIGLQRVVLMVAKAHIQTVRLNARHVILTIAAIEVL